MCPNAEGSSDRREGQRDVYADEDLTGYVSDQRGRG